MAIGKNFTTRVGFEFVTFPSHVEGGHTRAKTPVFKRKRSLVSQSKGIDM